MSVQALPKQNPHDTIQTSTQLTDVISEPFNGQQDQFSMMLPQGEMKMLHRVVKVNEEGGEYGKGELVAEFDITPDLWFFKCHFPGDPIMPGCLGVDALWQALGLYLARQGYRGKCRALGVKDVQFFGEILPSVKIVTFHVHVKRIVNRSITMIVGDGYVYADGREIYSAKHLKAALI